VRGGVVLCGVNVCALSAALLTQVDFGSKEIHRPRQRDSGDGC